MSDEEQKIAERLGAKWTRNMTVDNVCYPKVDLAAVRAMFEHALKRGIQLGHDLGEHVVYDQPLLDEEWYDWLAELGA